MLPDERSEHEPDEPDLGPDVPEVGTADEPDLRPHIPDVSPPGSEDGFFGPEGTPKELLSAFWKLVMLFNFGILAASLGLLFLVFEARLYLGGGLFVGGLLAIARGVYRYRRIDPHSLGDGDSDDDGGEGVDMGMDTGAKIDTGTDADTDADGGTKDND